MLRGAQSVATNKGWTIAWGDEQATLMDSVLSWIAAATNYHYFGTTRTSFDVHNLACLVSDLSLQWRRARTEVQYKVLYVHDLTVACARATLQVPT